MSDQERSHELADRYGRALLPVFGTPQRVLARGEGVHVWDTDGKQYLDLLAGIAVNSLGHAHPALLSAISKQAETLGHVSNFFASAPQIELAEKLLELADAPAGSGVFFANSGTEANEAAFKIARRTGRPRILALQDSFHGRTMGALALTSKEAYRAPFEPLPGGVEFLEVGDEQALANALAPGDVAAVFAEPIQGEAGVRALDPDYLRALRRLTREHGTTFGGNPIAAAAGLAVIGTILEEGLLTHVRDVGEELTRELLGLAHPLIQEVRGAGLLLGIGLNAPVAPQLAAAALEAGFIVNAPNPTTLRLAPPLVITPAQLATFTAALPALLEAVAPEGEN